MKCDKGSRAWNNLRISHIHVFLQNLGQRVPRKINMEFAKVRRKKKFFGEDGVFQMKEFRTTLTYNKFVSCGFDQHYWFSISTLKSQEEDVLRGIHHFPWKKT